MDKPRVLVVGCGGIGGIVAGTLLEQGEDVTILSTNRDIAEAVSRKGIILREGGIQRTVKASASVDLATNAGPFDWILLATQPPQVEAAARLVSASLAPDGHMVCFQNGLCEERIASIVGRERTVGAIVAWAASMVSPGVYDRTAAGGFVIGHLDEQADKSLDELGRMLEAVGPVQVTRNLRGARWSKLAINCAISGLGTIGGETLGSLMKHRFVRRLALEIMTEAVDVAKSEKVHLEKVFGTLDLKWVALSRAERRANGSPGLVAKHTLLLAVGARFRRMRSSMLSAIERGRPPAVEFLNGEVVERARRYKIAVPVNSIIRDTVHAIARKEKKSRVDLLREIYTETRP